MYCNSQSVTSLPNRIGDLAVESIMKKQKVKGSGRKQVYGEATTTIAFRVPVSKQSEVKELVNAQLKVYKADNLAQQNRI